MMWQGNGCVMYEISFVNFWVIILCPFSYIKPNKMLSYRRETALQGAL